MSTKLSILDFQEIAKQHNGKCLSMEYTIGSDGKPTRLEFECEFHHRWFANPHDIRNSDSWCPHCAGRARKTSADLLKLIESYGWKCLDIERFVDTKTSLWFECPLGHKWTSHYNRIHTGTNCPTCVNRVKLTIEQLQSIAIEHGGMLLSTTYKNNKQKLQWECEQRHQFWMTAKDVKVSHQWCPLCSEFKAESTCREIFEELYGKPFVKIRPKWLMGYKGVALELDGYCSELKIAFEYNGIQHYKRVPAWHSETEFAEQQARDRRKIDVCKKEGVRLVIIPYMVSFTKDMLRERIVSLLEAIEDD